MPKLESFEIGLNIPLFGSITGTWVPKDAERKAAWELYVELVSRISIVELKKDEGDLREALTSLYSLFQTTREILRKYGPEVAVPNKKNNLSFGKLAIIILNYQLRPILSKWHPLLTEYEEQRANGTPRRTHVDKWKHNEELRDALNDTRNVLMEYSVILATIANVEPLYSEERTENE